MGKDVSIFTSLYQLVDMRHEALTSRIVNKNIRIMIASCTIALVQVFRNKWA